jgi:lysophospholipase L1-like esterase
MQDALKLGLRGSRRLILGVFLALPIVFGVTSCGGGGGGGGGSSGSSWLATWYGAPQRYTDLDSTSNPVKTIQNQTYRQIMYISQGGNQLRLRVSNIFGTHPLSITSMRIAKSLGGASIDTSTDTAVSFGGQTATTVPIGQEIYSDTVNLAVDSNSTLAVSTFVAGSSQIETVHLYCLQSNYLVAGNMVSASDIAPSETDSFYAWVTGIDVQGPSSTKVIVAFGDSITYGGQSTTNANNRYPNYLSRALVTPGSGYSVVNAGISGNHWSAEDGGPSGIERFGRDVLDRSGAKFTVVLLGINDIASQQLTADQIIQDIKNAAAAAKAKGIKYYEGTLTPYAVATAPGYYSAAGEAEREAVNAYIRSSVDIDGYVDFDMAIRDPNNPSAMLPAFDSGDHLHPSDAGYAAMATAAAAALK